MSLEDEIDEFNEKMEKEYQELFPPKRRRFTFTEMRERYRKKKSTRGENGQNIKIQSPYWSCLDYLGGAPNLGILPGKARLRYLCDMAHYRSQRLHRKKALAEKSRL